MALATTIDSTRYAFADLKDLLAKASPARSGDALAGVAARSAAERVAARMVLADLPLRRFLTEALIPYESDEITRLIVDHHDAAAFAPLVSLTVGEFREWLLGDAATAESLAAVAPGLTPEMAAAASKLMRNQDLVAVARKCRVVTAFRDTLGLPGRMSVRLQPNHPTDDPRGIAASILDGLMYGTGDAVIGINPASDSLPAARHPLAPARRPHPALRDPHAELRPHPRDATDPRHRSAARPSTWCSSRWRAPRPPTRASASIWLSCARPATRRSPSAAARWGTNVMYFETGQGSALSADAHHGVDQQTCEARAYAVARHFEPLLVNTVVGFIGPEYLYDGKQIIRAGLEDHFCGKLLGLPMGCDICYTNHAEADADDMDSLLTMLGAAGVNFIMGVPGADDVMLGYQSTSFHDAALPARRPRPPPRAGVRSLARPGCTSPTTPAACCPPRAGTGS